MSGDSHKLREELAVGVVCLRAICSYEHCLNGGMSTQRTNNGSLAAYCKQSHLLHDQVIGYKDVNLSSSIVIGNILLSMKHRSPVSNGLGQCQ